MKKSELKDRILETSVKLFEKHGFHGVSVNDIVKASDTSKGGFYHHFQSKDDLLFNIHDTFITYVLTKAKEASHSSQTPPEKLQQIIRSFTKVFDLYQSHISVFYQESKYLNPNIDHIIRQKRNQFRYLINNVLQEGQYNGDFRPEIPFDIGGLAILGIVNWTSKWYQKNGEKSMEEISDIFIDFIMHGVLTEEAKDRNPHFFLTTKGKRLHKS